ncbi:hypothetical protein AC630_41240 [Bradyrhizobium sp. AS23.2]|nr:hypothetical protein AC630_41240 [Bradyrhizobium sp. AS23.2]
MFMMILPLEPRQRSAPRKAGQPSASLIAAVTTYGGLAVSQDMRNRHSLLLRRLGSHSARQ